MTRRRFVALPLVVRRLRVLAVTDVTPRMRRVTLGGADLGARRHGDGELAPFTSPGFDDHVKLLFSTGAPLADVLPRQLPHGIEWTPHPDRVDRDYTPRRVTPTELDLDFVLHSDGPGDGGAGPAERWATSARPGDEVAVVGPKSSAVLPDDIDHVVLVADETGLPAVGRFLDERPTDAPVTVVAVVPTLAARQPLAARPDDRVVWVEGEPGDPAPLLAAVRDLDPATWAGRPFVWAAAESRALLPLRRHLSRERGLPRDRLDVTGYWHLRTDPVAPDRAADVPTPAAPALPASPVAWLALRAALQLGVLDALDERARTADEVAAATGTPPGTVQALLDVLTEAGVVSGGGASPYEVAGPARELLADDHERDELVGPAARAVLALGDLAAATRAGRSAWEEHHGRTLAASARADADVAHELEHEAEGLAYLAPGLVALPLWADARRVLAAGPGAEVVRAALADAGVPCGPLGADTPDAPDTPRAQVDVVVDARTLAALTDGEARTLLAARTEVAPVLVLVEAVRADDLARDPAASELLQVGRTGVPRRSTEQLAALAATAGWSLAAAHDLGWGVQAVVLRR